MCSLIKIATAILGLTSTLVAAGVPHSRRSGGSGFSPFLKDGFPNPNPVQVRQIQNQSLGTLPNTAPPKNISQEGLNNLRVIAANELFEVAFFNQLLSNVTNNVTGYTVPDKEGQEILIKTLTAVQAVCYSHLHLSSSRLLTQLPPTNSKKNSTPSTPTAP